MSKVWSTNGASSGIGMEIARTALAAGDQVLATGREAKNVQGVLGSSDRLAVLSLDVTMPRQSIDTVEILEQSFAARKVELDQ